MNSFKRSGNIEALDPQLAMKAARELYLKAAAAGEKAAIVGGLAMQIFGFTRATKDVDMVASAPLNLEAKENLEFGGVIYRVEIEGHPIEIDWVVRSDDKRPVYEAALDAAEMTEYGVPVVAPEWMVILKYLAGRGKDEMDLMWLLREPGLVNREKVVGIVEQLMGPAAFWAKEDLKAVFLEADFMKERDQRGERRS